MDIEDIANNVKIHNINKKSFHGIKITQRRKPVNLDTSCGENYQIYAKTYGCSHNTSDCEYMMGLLEQEGYRITHDILKADLVLLNSCTVKNPSESAVFKVARQSLDRNQRIIISGCVPQSFSRKERQEHPILQKVSFIGTRDIMSISSVAEETLKGNTVHMVSKCSKNNLPSLNIPKIRRKAHVEIIPINTGCLGACTYCKTKLARGKLTSYPIKAIIERILECNSSTREIWLTSEDTGAYGRDINTDIGELLREIIKIAPHCNNIMFRLGMTNPPYILEKLDEIAWFLNQPMVYKFLHIPVQSGNNMILKAMNREYTREEFERVCTYMMEKVPMITIATDIICGFPGETQDQFNDSLSLIKKFKFPIVNISQFYPRNGTPAAKLPQLPHNVKKSYSKQLDTLFHSYNPNSIMLGRCVRGYGYSLDDMIAHTNNHIKLIRWKYMWDSPFGWYFVTSTCKWHLTVLPPEVILIIVLFNYFIIMNYII